MDQVVFAEVDVVSDGFCLTPETENKITSAIAIAHLPIAHIP